MIKKINKPNETNDIISLPTNEGNINLALKNNSRNIIGSFYFNSFSDIKAIKKFIKNIESRIRASNEYKDYIGHLNNSIGINRCSIFGNITNEDEVSLEFHHYPFTLYEIVEIVINDKVKKGEQFTSFDIIDTVLDLHAKNMIGLVKLSKTAHELVHAGQIFVKLDSVFGKVNDFIEMYKQTDSIPLEIIENYNKLIEMNQMDFKNYALYIKNSVPELNLEISEEEELLKLEINKDE